MTDKVPNGTTPQSNSSRNGSLRELPDDISRPSNDEVPGMGIGDEPGRGMGDEVGSGKGIKAVPVLEVGIAIGIVRLPKRSRNSNRNRRRTSSLWTRTLRLKRVLNGVDLPQDGIDRNSGRRAAGSTVTNAPVTVAVPAIPGPVGLFVERDPPLSQPTRGRDAKKTRPRAYLPSCEAINTSPATASKPCAR
jgi:hypothetical protein